MLSWIEASFFLCVFSELRKAGHGERNGQTHDQRRAAGQQVRHGFLQYPGFSWSSCLSFFSPLYGSPLLMVWICLIRSQDISADRTELTLPASIEFRDNCECSRITFCLFIHLTVSVTQSIAGNYWTLSVPVVTSWTDKPDLIALEVVLLNNGVMVNAGSSEAFHVFSHLANLQRWKAESHYNH